MRKYIIILFVALMSLVHSNAQVTINFSSSNVDQSGNASVNVSVQNFNDLVSAQFSINWDSLVLDFTSFSNLTTTLPVFNENALGAPNSGPLISNGQITFSWYNPSGTGVTIPNNTVLFTINYTAIGEPCDSTFVKMTGIPREIEFVDGNIETLPPSQIATNPGLVKINGTNCSDNPPPPPSGGLIFTIPMITASPGDHICIPVKVDSFENIYAGQGIYSWNPAILHYTGVSNDALNGIVYNTSNIDNGRLGFVWLTPDVAKTLPDGATMVELCFDVLGTVGSMSPVNIEENDTEIEWSWINDDGDPVPNTTTDGKITITNTVAIDTVRFTITDVTVDQNDTVCVNIKVANFKDIASIQGTITFNSAIAQFVNTDAYNLPSLTSSAFNLISSNELRFNWLAPGSVPITLADGTSIFSVCFKGVGDCMLSQSSVVDLVNVTGFQIEIINGSTTPPTMAPYSIDAGSVKINPCDSPCSATITSFSNAKCNGSSDGAISVSITGADNTCQCVWKRNGANFQTNSLANCNLTNIPAGTYKLEVTCAGVVTCMVTQVITEPAAINIIGSLQNVACNQKGAVTLSTPTGGTSPYTYKWAPNGETTQNISNLDAGTFTVTVTDMNSCTATKSFIIEEKVDELTATGTVTNVACFGDNSGAILVTPAGGCSPYTYSWTPSTVSGSNPQNLPAGNYTVTVSDSSTPANTVVKSFTITQPLKALSVTNSTTASTGSNGTISLNITDGTSPYSTKWTGGIPDNTVNASGLTPGTYTVTVTDANGCTKSSTAIVEVGTSTDTLKFSLLQVISEANNNGFGVPCNGDCKGQITGAVIGGTPPYNVTLEPTTKSITLQAPGNISFDNICAGDYTAKITDANNKIFSTPIKVTQPEQIKITSITNCTEGILSNGSINITVSGGISPFAYEWSNTETTEDITNLPIGNYSVVVTDNNNCEALLNNIRITNCDDNNCYKSMSVITPNNDGSNDAFVISCAMDFRSDLYVYDRWGKLVFQQNTYDNTWTGLDLNGVELPEGGYMWVLDVDFGAGRSQVFKGSLALLRN